MLLLLVLLAVAGHAVANIYQMPLTKIQSRMVQLLRAGTWASHVKEMKQKRYEMVDAPAEKSHSRKDISSYYDMEYIANITIGTPEQTVKVVIDTGSADTWVVDHICVVGKPSVCEESICDQGMVCKVFCPSLVCCKQKLPRKTNHCRAKHYFDSAKSSSYVPTKGYWTMEYRPDGKVEGFYGNDTVRLGDAGTKQLVVPGTKFGQAVEIDEFLSKRPIDGVVGLAFSALSNNNAVSPFERAYKLGLVDPIFTVYMERVGRQSENSFGGMVTYGGLDTQHCGKIIAYEPLSKANYWIFKVIIVTAGSYAYEYKGEAISDTSSSFFGTSAYNAREIAASLNATYIEEHDLYYIDCKADVSITLTIGKHQYTIETENLIIHVEEDTCILALYGYSNFWISSWILGAPFIRQFCNIYDMGNQQIGFAKSL